jgi:class 3 adenylate cyclase/predicted ATPase/DNA-binding winged helix-turn-helix (wHTH) protein
MLYTFGDYQCDTARYELRRAGALVAIEPKAFTVLAYLIAHRDRVVTKAELLDQCWSGIFVSDMALTRCLARVRQAVGDDGPEQRIIKTIRGHGYRFVAALATPGTTPAHPALPEPSHPHSAAEVQPPPLPSGAPLPCPQCQTINKAARLFCAACGHALAPPCPQCGFRNDPSDRFCGGCGNDCAATVVPPISDPARTPFSYTPPYPYRAAQILTARSTLEGERKHVTVLCAHLEGTTALAQAGDPEVLHEVLHGALAVMLAEVQRVEGTVTQVRGDGIMALFGAPIAQEDHVLRALHAALGMQRTLATAAAELPQRRPLQAALRQGVHTGLVVVGTIGDDLRMDYTAQGVTTHLAERLQHLAPAGRIYVSEAVRRQAEGLFRFHDLGARTVAGLAHPVPVYECLGAGQESSRLAASLRRRVSRFVGRRREMVLLRALWTRVGQGQGQVVCLFGEAGVGKSRLAFEYRQILTGGRLLEAQTLAYGHQIPYHAIVPLVRALLAVSSEAAPHQQRQQLRAQLVARYPGLASEEPVLAHLLGLPLEPDCQSVFAPEDHKRRLQQACLQLILHHATDRPLCLFIEDVHWLDPSSQEVLEALVATLARRPILLLTTARPGFRHTWDDLTYFHRLTIEPLAHEHTDALIRDYFRPYDAAVALKDLIRERTEGNPFFVEELLRTLQEQGLLAFHEGVFAVQPGAPLALSASVQGVLAARIDRLPPAAKRCLQAAAVIGREVPLALLQAIIELSPEAVHGALAHLQAAEFVYESWLFPDRAYTFKHTLMQDAAYQSLLRSARQHYHQRIAQVLEAQFPETVAQHPELLARHCMEAGLTGQAVAYWYKAGQSAVQRSAHAEAIAHLRQGLALLATLPATPQHLQREVHMSIALGASLSATQGYGAPEVGQIYTRARQLCQGLDEPHQLFSVLRGLCGYYFVRAEYQTALLLGEQLLTLARHVHDSAMLLTAHRVVGTTLFKLGAVAAAQTHLAQGIALYDPQQHRASAFLYGEDAGVMCRSRVAWALWYLGSPDQGLRQSHEGVTLARQSAHPFSLSFALACAALLHQLRRETQLTQERAEAAISLAQAQGFPLWMAHGCILRGWALAHQGQAQEGITQITQGLSAFRATGAEINQSYFLALLAEAYGTLGQPEAGRTVLTEALARVDTTGERWYEPELYRLKGELLLQQSWDNQAEAERCFLYALEIAHNPHAKSFELRAATSLARLWQQDGKHQEAHDLLASVYGWFTEGFDTADLQEAKALLETLT